MQRSSTVGQGIVLFYFHDRSVSIASRSSVEELSLPMSNRWLFPWEKNKSAFSSCPFPRSACPSERVVSEIGTITMCGKVGFMKESRLPFVWLSWTSTWDVSVLSPVLLLFKANGREHDLKELLKSSSSGGLGPTDCPHGSSKLMEDRETYGKRRRKRNQHSRLSF